MWTQKTLKLRINFTFKDKLKILSWAITISNPWAWEQDFKLRMKLKPICFPSTLTPMVKYTPKKYKIGGSKKRGGGRRDHLSNLKQRTNSWLDGKLVNNVSPSQREVYQSIMTRQASNLEKHFILMKLKNLNVLKII